jgi:hypothetical protein
MSLAPGEQRTLAEIESRLGRSDPQLVAMFDRFTVEDTPKGSALRPMLRCPPGPGGRARLIILIVVSVTLLAASLAVGMIAASRTAPPPGEIGGGAGAVGTYLPGSLWSGRVTSGRLPFASRGGW